MLRSYLEVIILDCVVKINGERTIYSIFHILKGKKSSQTIQDSHLFDLSHYFRVFPALNRDDFQQTFMHLQTYRYIDVIDFEKGHYRTTNITKKALEQKVNEQPLPVHLNGFRYHMIAKPFWERFSLLFQVLSNAVHRNSKYYSIQRDATIQQWVKQFVFRSGNIRLLSNHLHEELHAVLSTIPKKQADMFVLKLSGYERIGQSDRQIADLLGLDEVFVHISVLDVVHLLIETADKQHKEHKLLAYICSDLLAANSSPITQSSLATLAYYNKGMELDEIAAVRNLKRSTIEDHIVELAIHQVHFDITPFVSERLVKLILKIASEADTKQLKYIKESISEDVTYFQIRLALAKGGRVI